jgi:hypothetical protein
MTDIRFTPPSSAIRAVSVNRSARVVSHSGWVKVE